MDRSIRAGIIGFLIAVTVNIFLPVYLDFFPSFVIAIFVTFIFGVETFKDGLVTAFMTYLFNDGILGTISLATFYASNQPYPAFTVDAWTMISPAVSALSAVVAAYVGVWLARRRKPVRESSPLIRPQTSPA